MLGVDVLLSHWILWHIEGEKIFINLPRQYYFE